MSTLCETTVPQANYGWRGIAARGHYKFNQNSTTSLYTCAFSNAVIERFGEWRPGT